MTDLYPENYDTDEKTEEGINKWKDILIHRDWKNIVKMSIHAKQSTNLMKSLSNFQWHFSQK